MKKATLLFLFMQGLVALHAQTGHTNTGTSSGTAGDYNSFYGYFAGNVATSSGTNNSFFGAQSGKATTSGIQNVAIGSSALFTNTTGLKNTAIGYQSLYSNTSGQDNAGIGNQSLYSNTTGNFNVGLGNFSLKFNTTGTDNTGLGYGGLRANTTGNDNSALGYAAMWNSTTASNNTAIGSYALFTASTGSDNTAVGFQALRYSTTGEDNVAVGINTLLNNKSGNDNVAVGAIALSGDTSGYYNVAVGSFTMYHVTSGFRNTAVGYHSANFITTGHDNTFLGDDTDTDGGNYSNSMALGALTLITASNQVRVGNGATSIGGGVGWTTLSDGRFKRDIKEDISGLNFISQLRPVSYVIDQKALDISLGRTKATEGRDETTATPKRRTGFIAQEVEAVAKKLSFDFSGVDAPQNSTDLYGLRYAEFVVPLVRAVQELNAKVDSQQKKIDSLLSIARQGIPPVSGNDGANQMALFQNSPNPFSSDTDIKMTLNETAQRADLIIYDMQGTQLKSILVKDRGNAKVSLQANELSAGMYFYALIVDNQVIDTKRMILTK